MTRDEMLEIIRERDLRWDRAIRILVPAAQVNDQMLQWIKDHGYKHKGITPDPMTYFMTWIPGPVGHIELEVYFHETRSSDAMIFKLTFGGK